MKNLLHPPPQKFKRFKPFKDTVGKRLHPLVF
jgi:hypothetical protein